MNTFLPMYSKPFYSLKCWLLSWKLHFGERFSRVVGSCSCWRGLSARAQRPLPSHVGGGGSEERSTSPLPPLKPFLPRTRAFLLRLLFPGCTGQARPRLTFPPAAAPQAAQPLRCPRSAQEAGAGAGSAAPTPAAGSVLRQRRREADAAEAGPLAAGPGAAHLRRLWHQPRAAWLSWRSPLQPRDRRGCCRWAGAPDRWRSEWPLPQTTRMMTTTTTRRRKTTIAAAAGASA